MKMRLRVKLVSLLTGALLAGCGGGGSTDTATGIGSATSSMAAQVTGPRSISVYGDSVAYGTYLTQTNCAPLSGPFSRVSPAPTLRIAAAAGGTAGVDKTVAGSTLGDLVSDPQSFKAQLGQDPSEVIVLRFGGNDASQAVSGTGAVEPGFYETMTHRTKTAIETILAVNKIPVVVGVPMMGSLTTSKCYVFTWNDSFKDPIWQGKLNAATIADNAMKAEAARQGVLFVDLRNGSVPFSDDLNVDSANFWDGIHPNPTRSNVMSDLIGSKISTSLRDWPVTSVATSTQIWPNTNLMDLNLAVGWSSAYSPTPNHLEHLAYWFDGYHPVNYVKLYPRVVNGKSLGFPASFNVYWSNGSAWNMVKSYTNFPSPTEAAYVVLPLPSAVSANGILVVATTLGSDDYSGYYFQMQEVGAGYDSSRP